MDTATLEPIERVEDATDRRSAVQRFVSANYLKNLGASMCVLAVLMGCAMIFWPPWWKQPNLFLFWAGAIYLKWNQWADRHWRERLHNRQGGER